MLSPFQDTDALRYASVFAAMALLVCAPGPRGGGSGVGLLQIPKQAGEDSIFFWRVLDSSWIAPAAEPVSNDDGQFAWGISYRLEAVARYLTVVPGDSGAWALLRRDALGALAARDSLRGLIDYHGRSRMVWSATKYSEPAGVRAAWLVQNAMIVGGLGAAVDILRRGGPADRALADSALKACWSAMLAFDADLHNDPQSHGMYYRFPTDIPLRAVEQGREVPLNQQAAAGRAWQWLANLTGSSSAHGRAEGLGHFILTRMLVEDSSFVWHYELGSIMDDVSHGGVVAAFLMMLPPSYALDGLPVRRGLAGTMHRMFSMRGDTVVVADYVDGRVTREARFAGSFGTWAAVLPAACDLMIPMERALWKPSTKLNSPGPLGASLLLQAQDSCPGADRHLQALISGGE